MGAFGRCCQLRKAARRRSGQRSDAGSIGVEFLATSLAAREGRGAGHALLIRKSCGHRLRR